MKVVEPRELVVGQVILSSQLPAAKKARDLNNSFLIYKFDDNDIEFCDWWMALQDNKIQWLCFKSTEQVCVLY